MGSLERSRWASKLAGLALSLLPGTSCAACGGGGGTTRSTQPRFILLLFLSFVLAGCGGSGNGASPAAPLNSLPVPPRTTDSNLPYSFLIQSDQSTQQQPLVLNVTDNVAQNGTPIIAYGPPFCDLPLCSGPSPVLNTPLDKNELWTFVPSSAGSTTGYFMTALGSNLALSAVPSASGGYSAELVPLQTDVLEGGGDKFQLWSVSDYNPATGQAEIVSELNGYLLYNPYTTAASSSVISTTPTTSVPPQGLGFHWTFTPDYSLARILAQPPQPFPPLDQQAYSCINANLSPPTTGATCTLDKQPTVGLRCEYENLTDLSTFAFDLENPTGPVQTNCGALSGFAATENQLIAELGDAGFIDALYQNVMTVTNSALSSVTGDIPNLIGDVAVGVTQQVSGVGIDLFEGLIGNALWSVGDEGGVLATILGVALEAAIDQDKISEAETFQNAADKIYTNYDSLFATLLSEATDQQTAILGDWGEMQAVAALTQSTQLNSLFWTPNLTSQLEIYLPKALDVSFMKILMPTRFQLCSINYSSVNSLTTTFIQFPSYGPGFVNELDVAFNSPGNGVFNLYDMQTIADCQNNTSPTYPIQNALDQDLFANGVSPYDLFTGNNGWGGVFQATTNPTDLIDANDLANQGCDAMTSTIQNQTATALAYNVNNTHGYLLTANASSQGNGPISGTIPPYGTLTVASIVGAGITDDYQLSSGGQQIAGFSLNMDNCQTRLKGQTPYISDSTSSNGFEVRTTQITRGLFNTTPGLATVAIYNQSAAQ